MRRRRAIASAPRQGSVAGCAVRNRLPGAGRGVGGAAGAAVRRRAGTPWPAPAAPLRSLRPRARRRGAGRFVRRPCREIALFLHPPAQSARRPSGPRRQAGSTQRAALFHEHSCRSAAASLGTRDSPQSTGDRGRPSGARLVTPALAPPARSVSRAALQAPPVTQSGQVLDALRRPASSSASHPARQRRAAPATGARRPSTHTAHPARRARAARPAARP